MSYVAAVGVDLRLPPLRPIRLPLRLRSGLRLIQGKLFSLRAKGFLGFASLAITSDRIVALHQFGAYADFWYRPRLF